MRMGPAIVNDKENIFKQTKNDGKRLLDVTFNLVIKYKKRFQKRNIIYHYKTISTVWKIYHRKRLWSNEIIVINKTDD